MSIRLHWHNDEHTILNYQFEGDWSLDEYREKMRDANLLIITAGHTVHILLDLSKSNKQPFGMMSARLTEGEALPANQGAMLVYQANYHLSAILEIADRDGGYKPVENVHFIEDFAELPSLLAEIQQ